MWISHETFVKENASLGGGGVESIGVAEVPRKCSVLLLALRGGVRHFANMLLRYYALTLLSS